MTALDSSPTSGHNGTNLFTCIHRIVQSIENLTNTCIDDALPIQKQRDRIKGRSSDIRRSINKLNAAAEESPPRFSVSMFGRSNLPALLDKLDERIGQEPLLQEAHTMFDALSKLSRLIEDEPRAVSYDIKRVLAWAKFHERLGDKVLNPQVPRVGELVDELDAIVRRAHDPNNPITLKTTDIDNYASAHATLTLLASQRLER